MSALLEVSNLHVRFPLTGPVKARLIGLENRFLDAVLDVSFSVAAGTTFALVGESGSGKSTLGRAIIGLVPMQAGRVRFDGEEPLLHGRAAIAGYRRQVAMMFRNPVASLSPRLTVKSLITEPFVIHGMKGKDLGAEARRSAGACGTAGGFRRPLSAPVVGGQARRVGVARALALSPKLIADEPTAGPDVSVQGEILNLLARLQRELGLTYLIITHNLAVVRHVSDEMAIMYMGRFLEHGPTRDIFAQAAHPYTHGLLAPAAPRPDRRRDNVELQGEVPSLAHRPSGCEFHTRCPRARELCRSARPERQTLAPGHDHRCHFPLVDAAA
jgi:oligopeptide/dipeptide ABC transporter ATP-binding protein